MLHSDLQTRVALPSPDEDPVITAGKLFEHAASLNEVGVIDSAQLREVADAVGALPVAAALLNFKAENKADITIDDNGALAMIQFRKDVGGTALHEVVEPGLEESPEDLDSADKVSAFSDKLLKAIYLASSDASQEKTEVDSDQEQIPAYDKVPTRIAVEWLLSEQEGGMLFKGGSTSAGAEISRLLESSGHSRTAVNQALRTLTKNGIVVADKKTPSARIIESIRHTNPEELSEEVKNAKLGIFDTAKTEETTKKQAELARTRDLKREFMRLLKERNAGFYNNGDESINDQIEAMVRDELGVEGEECIALRKSIRENPNLLSISFASENGKKRTVEYVGLLDFMDDPLSLIQIMLNNLRALTQQHKRNAVDHRAPVSSKVLNQSMAMMKKYADVTDWTDYPYSVLEESMEVVKFGTKDMIEANRRQLSR